MIKDDICLVAGNLLLVAGGFSQRLREDLLDSVLFSQLYAGAKVVKWSDAESWYTECATAMERVKWQRTVYKNSSFEPKDDAGFSIRDSVVNQVHSLFGKNLVEKFEQLINCIEHSFVEEAVGKVLREHAVATEKTSDDADFSTIALQMGVLGPGPVLYSGFVCFRTSEEVEVDFLNQCFSGTHIVGEVSIDFAKQQLDRAAFERSRMREKIIAQLPDSRDGLILELCPGCIG
ncbi:hypothetical protein [Pseudomonas mohnii]